MVTTLESLTSTTVLPEGMLTSRGPPDAGMTVKGTFKFGLGLLGVVGVDMIMENKLCS